MDILIDLIVFLIKQATKPSAPRPLPPTRQQAQRQQSMLAQQIQAMQRSMAVQQRMPAAGRRKPAAPPAGPARVPASFVPEPVRTVSASAPAVVVRPTVPQSSRAAGLRVPFLLGELLSAPVAFRDWEF
jgi:hypothetical protein